MFDTTGEFAARGFGETVTEAITALGAKGYLGEFRVSGPGQVECLRCRYAHDARDIPIGALVRVEGVSDPADEQMIAGVTCPTCHTKGTLLLSYGSNASAEDGSVLVRLKDVRETH